MEYTALTLSMIMEGKEIPAAVHQVTSDTIANICRTADMFLWKLADDYYNMETRELDELAGALTAVINSVAEEVTAYRTDFIYDILNLQHIMKQLVNIDLLHPLPVTIIGIRKYGTDSCAFINGRIKYEGYGVYAAIYLVTLRDDGVGQTHMKVFRAVGMKPGMKPDSNNGRR